MCSFVCKLIFLQIVGGKIKISLLVTLDELIDFAELILLH